MIVIAAYGFFSEVFVFLFFCAIAIFTLLVGGFIGLFIFNLSDSVIAKLIGGSIIGITVLFSLGWVIAGFATFFDNPSELGINDVELYSTLSLVEENVLIKEPTEVKGSMNFIYLYKMSNGTEIALTKKQHKYVQQYPLGSQFRIIYNDNGYSVREYDYETNLFGEDKRGTPVIEATYVEIVEEANNSNSYNSYFD